MNELATRPDAERGADTAHATRPPMLAFATDAQTEAVLRSALTADLVEGAEIRRGGLEEVGRALMRNASPLVLLVDITGHPQPLAALGELSQLVEPDVRVLVIGDRQDLALYRGLTQGLGVLEYLFKPLTPEMVGQHFGPILTRQQTGPRLLQGGRVIAVTGVHGGVGATTIAANLAWHLAERERRHTLLLDGDIYGAAAAMLLSVKPRPGLRVALEHPDRVDDLFIDRTAQAVAERLHVLSGEGKLGETSPVAPGAMPKVLEMLRRRYKFLVCDAAVPASDIGGEMVAAAHQRVLVTEPSVAGARDALRYLAMPQAAGAGNAPLLVLNLAGLPGSLGQQKFESAIGRAPDLVIPYVKGTLREAADLGEPAASRPGPFARAIQALAFRAASVGGSAKPRRWRPWR